MRHRILIVDDQPSILFSMKEDLEQVGHSVACAHGTTEAFMLRIVDRLALLRS
jgi:CheY-like chemotaxis protein